MTNEKRATADEETRIAPYLAALLYPANERRLLPTATGRYCIRYTAEGTSFATDKHWRLSTAMASPGRAVTLAPSLVTVETGDEEALYKAGRASLLTIEKATLGSPYRELRVFKGCPILRAEVKAFTELRVPVQDARVKELSLGDLSTEGLIISEAALSGALHKAYGVNLASLEAMLNSVLFENPPNYLLWVAMQEKLARRAFGLTEPLGWDRSLPSIGSAGEGLPATRYYYLPDAYLMAALFELIANKEIPLPLPASDCAIRFSESGEDRAEVIFFDKGALEGSPPVLLQGRPEYGKATNKTLAEIFRYRHEIRETRELRRKALDTLYENENRAVRGIRPLAAMAEARAKHEQALTEEEKQLRGELREAVAQLYEKEAARQDEILGLYSELTRWAVQHKERILKTVREKQRIAGEVGEARTALSARAESFVQLPNNMDMLPAHFAAIPKGIVSGLELVNDPFGRAILRVGREPFEVPGQKARPHTPLTLPLVGLNDAEKSAAFEQAKLILGDNGPRWLLPQGLVAVSKLYRAGGGYSKESFVHRLYLNEWIDAMRPAQVPRFKEKGRGEAFGKDRSAKDLYHALLGVLHRLTYERGSGPDWSQLSGFYIIVEHGEDSRGIWTDIMLNPNLHRFVIGAEGLPYMMTNTEAMLSYDRASLDYTPAAQWGLEQLARENLYGRDTATLSDPKGGGITRLALAHRFGLIKGPSDRPSTLLDRLNTVLDNLGKAGVIVDTKIDGREKAGAEAFGVKLLVTMHDDYRKAYNLTKKENALARLDKQLEAPFAPPKKLSRTPPAPGQPRKRGRPPKKG